MLPAVGSSCRRSVASPVPEGSRLDGHAAQPDARAGGLRADPGDIVVDRVAAAPGVPIDGLAARSREDFSGAVRLVLLWGFAFALAVTAAFALSGPALIDVMTASPDVRSVARDFLLFVIASPALAVFAFAFDGVYIGATWARDMRNLMLASLAIFLAAWFALQPLAGKPKEKKPEAVKEAKKPTEQTAELAPKAEPQPKPEEKPKAETPKEAPKQAAKKPDPKPAKPKQASAPKKPTPPAGKKRDFDTDRIAALLNKIPDAANEAAPVVPSEEEPSEKARGQSNGTEATMSVNEIDALRARIAQCWSPPPGGLGAGQIVVKLRLKLNEDGTLVGYPTVANSGSSPFFQAAADSAVRAVFQCQPYTLPSEKYALWRDMILNFDPSEMYRAG